ncbi:MAG: NAD(P)/FAD-dependent oxidoreductase [Longimicrobiales bacterium]|nr:NAD(P)/FAD-dependent oxidoreductase [Longimicrobiales bacterium]
MNEIKDFTIIGGGPTGLFAAFYAGMRGLSTRIVDSLPELGGQLTALYPEKHIYDVGGFPRVLAKDLAQGLVDQALRFRPEVSLDDEVREIVREDGHFRLRSRSGEARTRAVLVAGGRGAFEPTTLECPGYDRLLHRGVEYAVKDPEAYRGRRVLIVGGGDSALDWALILMEVCERVSVAHRRDGWRAHQATVDRVEAEAAAGRLDLLTFHEVREIHGAGTVVGVTVFDNRTDEDRALDVDAVLTFLGFKPDLGPIREWGLELEKNRIRVSPLMETSVPGIYAAGDIVTYPGKLDLIATGFAEAAVAANNAARYVNPEARVNPGHSTSLAVFKDG